MLSPLPLPVPVPLPGAVILLLWRAKILRLVVRPRRPVRHLDTFEYDRFECNVETHAFTEPMLV